MHNNNDRALTETELAAISGGAKGDSGGKDALKKVEFKQLLTKEMLEKAFEGGHTYIPG